MVRLSLSYLCGLVLLAWSPLHVSAGEKTVAYASGSEGLHRFAAFVDDDDLADYKTVETAITTRITNSAPAATTQASYLGVHTLPDEQGRLSVALVEEDSPAAKIGVQDGDVLLKLDGQAMKQPEDVREFLRGKAPGDKVSLEILRGKQAMQMTATLAPPSRPLEAGARPGGGKGKGGGGTFDTRQMTAWKKDVYRLAVVCIEFPDVKHNDKVTPKHWEESLFSRNSYKTKSVTGQKVFGSMNDFYDEISYGAFHVEGKVFDYVQAGKKRLDYSQTATKTALLSEALDKLYERDGKEALAKFDGIFFMFAGGSVKTVRGGLYWPHKANFSHNGKRWSYFICPEGGTNMGNISVISHEFGHMLGLPDLYARPENPGSEGVGVWCTMSNQAGNGRPQHFSAWSKEQLDWIKPTIIDPTTPQKLILAPTYKSAKECYKVLVRPDGSEYFLLENRNKHGFDASLPGEGLLIWRVVRNRPILEESHGVTGPTGPRVFPQSVPFPTKANDAFTPYTVPSSRGQLGGGLPVHITNIRKLPDGRITFLIGYEFF